jgi:hypothetical protein
MYEDACTDYIFNPLTDYRKKIFKQVIACIHNGGDVLDLGSGAVGDYWAIGYISRIKSLVFADKSNTSLEIIRSRIQQISPDILCKNFLGTILMLMENKILPYQSSCETLAQDLVEKIKDFIIVDFLGDVPVSITKKFDTVVAIESVECVSTEAEFLKSCAWVYSVLKNEGFFHAAILRYDKATPRITNLITQGYEGALNPSVDIIRKNFERAGLVIRNVDVYSISDIPGYTELVHVIAQKIL